MHDLSDAGWDVPGWMLARVLDNYFAGEEPVPQGATDAEFDETARQQLRIASCATQTDNTDVCFAAPTEPPQGRRHRATPPNGTLSIGTPPPLTADMPPERSFELPDPHFVARYVPCTTGCQEPKVPKEPKRASFSLKAKESIHTTVQEQLLRTPS